MLNRLIPLLILIFLPGIEPGISAAAGETVIGYDKSRSFNEVWAYLMAGEESKVTGNEPFTDICYFSAGINYRGKLVGQKKVPAIFTGKKTRVHLVITELSNPSLSHFCLNPRYGLREELVKDIIEAAADFNGIQVDFESVASDDREYFISFLRELRRNLDSGKILSVAVPPRRTTVHDAYEYTFLAGVADRIIVMAYDQHWSTSAPGPVASLWWCREVTRYAKSQVGPGKLIMGIPLYARAWQDKKLARALTMHHLEEIRKNINPVIQVCEKDGPFFTYREDVTVTVYFDSIDSIIGKINLYSEEGVRGISFWRIGQGLPEIWDHLSPM